MAAIAQNKLRIKGFYLLVLWPFAGLFVSLRQYLRESKNPTNLFQGANNTGNKDIEKIGNQILFSTGSYDESEKEYKPFIKQ